MKTTALIPARLESKRFPNKLIKKINGTPIILKTYRSAIDTGLFDNVYVVSGDDKILELIKTEGGKTFKSLKNHNSGTDRIAEAVIKLDTDIVVNLQGDEPFTSKKAIESLIKSFETFTCHVALGAPFQMSFRLWPPPTTEAREAHQNLNFGEDLNYMHGLSFNVLFHMFTLFCAGGQCAS